MRKLRPCARCPFRTDIEPFIRADRAREIANALCSNSIFHCHETVDYNDEDEEGNGQITDKSKWCTGALIVMEKEAIADANQMVRIYQRVGGLDMAALDLEAPVPDSLEAWIERHRKAERAQVRKRRKPKRKA